MKYLISFFVFFVLIASASFAFAASEPTIQPTVYTFLEPVKAGQTSSSNPAEYYKTLYEIGVGLAGLLAVIMLAIGGVEYIASAANPSALDDAKKRIGAALLGLMIALASYLILQTINPNLINFNIDLKPVGGGAAGTGGGGPTTQRPGALTAQQVQNQLAAAGIFTKTECAAGQNYDCTRTEGMTQQEVDYLVGLKTQCGTGCTVFVSGARDGAHGDGMFDIRPDPQLNAYITGGGAPVSGTTYPVNGKNCTYESAGHVNGNGTVSSGAHYHCQ